MKSKLKFIIPVLLLVLGGAYKFVLAKPAPKEKAKVQGEVYVLPKDFLVNLSDGGRDANVVREFDLRERRFVEGVATTGIK